MANLNFFRIIYLCSAILLPGLFSAPSLLAAVKLPAIFSDKMVLQQRAKVPVWGWADPGEKIIVSGSWSAKTVSVTTDATGNWKLMLQTPEAGGPYTLTVKGNNNITLDDVLIGEVWVCSGQSNMGFTLKGNDKAKAEIALANLPNIRYYSVKRQYGLREFQDSPGSAWEKTYPENAGSFSAVAYFFSKKIHLDLKVPVGIVYAAWGGTPAEAWTPGTVLQKDTLLTKYYDRWKFILDNVGKDSARYHSDLEKWKQDSSNHKKPSEPQTLYYFNRPWREPSVLFNGMIEPVIPYGIKGVLWYQGESNVGYANEYYHLFSSMIDGWRRRWDMPKNFPFYFVQLAPYGYSDLNAAARVREAQYEVMQKISSTGMAVTTDVGNMKDIHPVYKKEVGERLALIAMSKNYGKKVNHRGPECKTAYSRDGKLVLAFTSSSPLLHAGQALKGFEIGYFLPGTDSIVFVNAQAKIAANKVIVWNDNIKEPVEVRYAWLLAGEANLSDSKGLPAFPFRKRTGKK